MNLYLTVNKKVSTAIAAIFAVFILTISAFALTAHAGSEGLAEPIIKDGVLYPVIDYAGLLSDEEEENLAQRIYEIQENYQSAIVILTIDSTGDRSAMTYAEDFYDYNGYGYGENQDGVIFLISMEDRSFYMDASGTAQRVYSDSDREKITNKCLEYLSSGEYYTAFLTFISDCGDELEANYIAGIFTPGKFFACLMIGLILAIIPLLIFVMQLRTVHRQSGAASYSQGGIRLSNHTDNFVRSTISKTRIPKDDNHSSSHTGSSGRSHSGTGGHF